VHTVSTRPALSNQEWHEDTWVFVEIHIEQAPFSKLRI